MTAVVVVGVLLGVGGRGTIAGSVSGRGAVGSIVSREDGFSGLLPLRLLGVDVDVEPGKC